MARTTNPTAPYLAQITIERVYLVYCELCDRHLEPSCGTQVDANNQRRDHANEHVLIAANPAIGTRITPQRLAELRDEMTP